MSELLLRSAVSAHHAGQTAEAARLYEQLLHANPRHFEALYYLGFLRQQQGETEDAIRLIGAALEINPRSPDAWYNHGCALMALGRNSEAVASFDAALAIAPTYLDATINRAAALMALDRNMEALAACERALALMPDALEALRMRAGLLQRLGKDEAALAAFAAVLRLDPKDATAHQGRGDIFLKQRRLDDAIAAYEQATAADPQAVVARGHLLHCKLHGCDWRGRAAMEETFARDIRNGRPVLGQIENLAFTASPEEQYLSACRWAATAYPQAEPPLWQGERYRHDRIRVAYLSADFHSHATAYLMAGVFEAHDKARFETIAVSFGPAGNDPVQQRLRGAFTHFLDVRGASEREIADRLRADEVDIAVDLKGYTFEARPGILAFRPAPIQVNYLGYPGTMGASYIDYIVADATVIPEDHQRFYSERVVYLPGSYQCNDARRPAAGPPTRKDASLPEQGFVFCCFNANYKIAPAMFDVWMRLLREVPGSVLWLLQSNPYAARNLKREAEHRGIAPDRLIFAPTIPTPEHLARHVLADLFLDTLPYNAHTTASDALWMGLPVLTCLGTSFAGRVAASLLHAVGVPELIAPSLDAYEALALRLARDPEMLQALREKLRGNRLASPLFDSVRFCRALESAYATMWQRHEHGEPPASFAVAGA